jgi:hypothetical protein
MQLTPDAVQILNARYGEGLVPNVSDFQILREDTYTLSAQWKEGDNTIRVKAIRPTDGDGWRLLWQESTPRK